MRAFLGTASLLVASACAPGDAPSEPALRDSADPADAEALPAVELPLTTEQLLSERVASCEQAVVVSSWQVVCRDETGTWLWDESTDTSTFLGAARTVAAAKVDGALWLVLDGQPWLWQDGERLALDLPVPVPIETLRVEADRLWMLGLGRLFSWSDGRLSEWSVEDAGAIVGFAATREHLHLAVPELVTLRLDPTGPRVETLGSLPVSSLTAGAADDLWFVSGGQLFRQQGSAPPLAVRTPAPAAQVVGPGPWVLGGGQSWRFADGAFHSAPLPVDAPLAVDSAGRLWTITDGEVSRHDPGRSVVVVGLPDPLSLATPVTLLPTAADSLDALTVWVDDQPLAVDERPLSVTLDPEALSPGEHVLRFFTESTAGDHLSTQPLWVGELPDVAWAEVAAINEEHCLACHGGATATDLSGAADWQRHIDDIIDLTTRGEMPLGEAPLTDDEVVAIRAWKHGGFP